MCIYICVYIYPVYLYIFISSCMYIYIYINLYMYVCIHYGMHQYMYI